MVRARRPWAIAVAVMAPVALAVAVPLALRANRDGAPPPVATVHSTVGPGTTEPGVECAAPGGGWPPASKSDVESWPSEALLKDDPQFAGAWYSPPSPVHAQVIHVAFTGDVERHDAALRARFDGPLCVVARAHPMKVLRQVQGQAAAFAREIGLNLTTAGVDVVANRVFINVVERDPQQARFDERFGADVVVVTGEGEYPEPA